LVFKELSSSTLQCIVDNHHLTASRSYKFYWISRLWSEHHHDGCWPDKCPGITGWFSQLWQ